MASASSTLIRFWCRIIIAINTMGEHDVEDPTRLEVDALSRKRGTTKMRTVIRLGRKADVLQDMQMTVAGVNECKSVSVSKIEKKKAWLCTRCKILSMGR